MKQFPIIAIAILIIALGCGCKSHVLSTPSQPEKSFTQDTIFPNQPPRTQAPEILHCYPNEREVQAVDMFARFDDLSLFQRDRQDNDKVDGSGWYYSPAIVVPIGWDQVIVSWNAGKQTVVEVTVVPEGHAEGYGECLTLGEWTMMPNFVEHRTGSTLKGKIGEVETDVVRLNAPAEAVQLIFELGFSPYNAPDKTGVKLITLSFFNGGSLPPKVRAPNQAVWGKALPVPKKAQLSYKGGVNWCSPSCVSMVLSYWARQLNKPELKVDVPQVAKGVRDSCTGSTGVWPFNTAYVGTFPGMKAYVRRLRDLTDIENEIAAGRPVIISINQNALLGKIAEKPKGHLIVVTGFTKQGDVLVNDPWAKTPEKVQRVYKRDNVIRAWSSSNSLRAAYIIEPIQPTER